MIEPQTVIDRMAETMTDDELARLPEGVAEHISVPGLLTDDQITDVLMACRGYHELTDAERAELGALLDGPAVISKPIGEHLTGLRACPIAKLNAHAILSCRADQTGPPRNQARHSRRLRPAHPRRGVNDGL